MTSRRSLSSASQAISPHVFLFVLYNLTYFTPLFLVYLFGYTQGGAGEAASGSSATMTKIALLYAIGVTAFVLGAQARHILRSLLGGVKEHHSVLKRVNLDLSGKLGITFVVVSFLISKIVIIPLGVYSQGNYFEGSIPGSAWAITIICSDLMVFIAAAALFSRSRHNVRLFALLSVLNGVCLLHGTRMFFISGILTAVMYAYVTGRLNLKRVIWLAPLSMICVLLLTYGIFLRRSNLSSQQELSTASALSPLVYESVFSQISLMNTLTRPDVWTKAGNVPHFFLDVVLFNMPRALVDKDEYLLLSRPNYRDLSPLGGFSGYADGLIYFGIFFPAFYFVVGWIGSFLYNKSVEHPFWTVLYVYYTADFLFRIMRDGYFIPIKLLLNTVEIALLFLLCREILRWAAGARNHPESGIEST